VKIATFSTDAVYAGCEVVFDNETFTIQGAGPIDVRHLIDFDQRGQISWESQELRVWAYDRARHAADAAAYAAAAAQPVVRLSVVQRDPAMGTVMIIGGLVLVVAGVILSTTVVGACIGIPVAMVGGAVFGLGFRKAAM